MYKRQVVGNMGCFEAASYYALQGVPQREGYDAWLAELTDVYKRQE